MKGGSGFVVMTWRSAAFIHDDTPSLVEFEGHTLFATEEEATAAARRHLVGLTAACPEMVVGGEHSDEQGLWRQFGYVRLHTRVARAH